MTVEQLNGATDTIKQLKDLIEHLESQLSQKYQLIEAQNLLAGAISGFNNDPFIGSRNAENSRYTTLGSINQVAMHNGRVGRHSRAQISVAAVPCTPTVQRPPRAPPAMGVTSANGRRHKRTETPEQLYLKAYTKEPLYSRYRSTNDSWPPPRFLRRDTPLGRTPRQ
jgi:hypothetical protein